MHVNILTKPPDWYGTHSGYYTQIPRAIQAQSSAGTVFANRRTRTARLKGKIFSVVNNWPKRDQSLSEAAWRFLRLIKRSGSSDANVILNVEEHLPLLKTIGEGPKNLIGTIHYPASLWRDPMLQDLKRFTSAVVLYRRDISFFERYVGEGRVKFVRHGVDTRFFNPGREGNFGLRILFVGKFLREWQLTEEVVGRISQRHPFVRFDFVVPKNVVESEISDLRRLSVISWHQNLTDEELLQLYRRSFLLFTPFEDSGANNTVVEAIACGLPVVTNDVGGIRDYGGGTIFPLATE